MPAYKRQLKDKNDNVVYPAISPIDTDEIKNGAITAEKLGFKLIDKVGTADNYCLKFFDGTMIACINYPFSVNVTTAWGSVYAGDLSQQTYAVPFYSIPVEVAGLMSNRDGDNMNAWIYRTGGMNSTTQTARYGIVRGTAATVTAELNIIAIGRWKA